VEVEAADGKKLYGALAKPADFDPAKKYPVVVSVYGGPHVQVVTDKWGTTTLFDHFLAQEGYLVWSLDNRGSYGRGHAWESAVFKNLGKKELEDQLAGVEYLKRLPYVDASRIGIWGGSYGGYMTLYALTYAPGIFHCGISMFPVTDWRFYDSIYTERYMRTPAENVEGYKNNSPLNNSDKLADALLLVHGTMDDNVHMQNSMQLVDALIKACKPFELQIYPGQKHGLRGEKPRLHFQDAAYEFFKRHLKPDTR
jgi:dipeptidyl-peptidase-4